MARSPFSARWVAAVKPPKNGQADYVHTMPPKSGLRVAPSGRKTWFVMYWTHGRLRRFTLGISPDSSLAEARKQAATVRHTVALGDAPALQKQQTRQGPTVAEMAGLYLERYAKVHKKSWRDDVRLLHKEVIPIWGPRKTHTISVPRSPVLK